MNRYIIDYSNWDYRFRSVYKFAKVEIGGVKYDTSVLYGFVRCLKSIPSDDIVIVLDGTPLVSKALLPGYKGNRNHDDQNEGATLSTKEVISVLLNMGDILGKTINVVCSPGQETDEVIASIAYEANGPRLVKPGLTSMLFTKDYEVDKRLVKYKDMDQGEFHVNRGDTIIIASTDGDFLQLQRFPNTFIDLSLTGKDVSNKHTSKSTAGMTPEQTILYKSIFGDVSDNLQGVSMSSSKKAEVIEYIKYVECMGDVEISLDNIFAHPTCNVEKFLYEHRSTIKVNYKVAFLEFRSYPRKLYMKCDPYEILNKCKIKLRCQKRL